MQNGLQGQLSGAPVLPSPLDRPALGLLKAQVGLFDVGTLEEPLARAFEGDPAVLEDITAMAELEGAQDVLLHEENGQASPIDALEVVEDRADDDGGQSQAGLIEHEEARLRHEASSD